MEGGDRSAGGLVAAEPVGDGEDGAEVVGGVAPFGGEPGVVEVEPADDGTDVKRALDGIELVAGAGDARAVPDRGAGDDGSEELGAGRIGEGEDAAGEGVGEAPAGGVVGLIAREGGAERVVGEIDEQLVGGGADVADVGGHGKGGSSEK